MQVVISQRRRRTLERLERAPSDAVMRNVIEHFLYAPRGTEDGSQDHVELESLRAGIDALPHLVAAEALTTEGWVALARKYILQREGVAGMLYPPSLPPRASPSLPPVAPRGSDRRADS